MYALASTLVTVTRGQTTNAWGDQVDDDTGGAQIVATGVPAQIVITSSRPYDQSSQTIRVIQTVSGAIGSDTDLTLDDRLIDERDSSVYAIESITPHNGPGYVGDLELALRRVV